MHVCLLVVPGRLVEIIFPREAPSHDENGITDPWPDFYDIALVVVSMPDRSAARAQTPLTLDTEDEESLLPAAAPSPQVPSGSSGDDAGQAGDSSPSPGHAEPLYFPPLPRLIVPPTLEDLGIASLRVNIKILVGADGVPEEVILADTISDPDVRRRILECARRFRFEPARLGSRPTSSWIDLPLVLESAESR